MAEVHSYHITGKIIPERVNDNRILPPAKLIEPNSGLNLDISTSILKSQISIDISSSSEITDFATLRNVVKDYLLLHTDSYGYIHGYAYDVEIISINGSNNKPHLVYGVEINEIESDITNRPIKNENEIANLMYEGKNVQLRLALADLRLAMQYPSDTGVHCLRAVESIREHFGSKDNKGWTKFRCELGISREFLEPIEGAKSWKPRHGKSVPISHSERIEIMKRTWKIVDRFIVYIKNGEMPLDKNEFPEL